VDVSRADIEGIAGIAIGAAAVLSVMLWLAVGLLAGHYRRECRQLRARNAALSAENDRWHEDFAIQAGELKVLRKVLPVVPTVPTVPTVRAVPVAPAVPVVPVVAAAPVAPLVPAQAQAEAPRSRTSLIDISLADATRVDVSTTSGPSNGASRRVEAP
jgi:hypothetical protein